MCEICNKKYYDTVNGVMLCAKHFNNYTKALTAKLKREDRFAEVYKPPQSLVRESNSWRMEEWSHKVLSMWVKRNRKYCNRLREQTKQKLGRTSGDIY